MNYRVMLVLLALLLPASALLGACGGGSKKTDADEWVRLLCAAATDYDTRTNRLVEQVGEKLDPGADPVAAKAAAVALIKAVDPVLERFKEDVDKIGEPDVEGGSDVRKAVDDRFDLVEQSLNDAQDKAEDLDPKSSKFEDDLNAVFEELNDESSFRDRLEAIDNDEVRGIIADIDADPDCAAVIFDSDTDDSGSGSNPTPRATTVARSTPLPNASDNEKWVSGLCIAVTSFVEDIGTLSSDLDVPANPTPKQLKDAIVAFLEDATDRGKQLREDIDDLGDPDVKDGDDIEDAMVDAAGEVVRVFEDATDDVRKLSTSDGAKLESELVAIGGSLEEAASEIEDAFGQIDRDFDTSELTRAAEDVPECIGVF